jgi:hypothetical protein
MIPRRTRGYAVVNEHGKILVATVSPHARGAKVNWLHRYAGINVLDTTTDAAIHGDWLEQGQKHRVSRIEVEIREIEK